MTQTELEHLTAKSTLYILNTSEAQILVRFALLYLKVAMQFYFISVIRHPFWAPLEVCSGASQLGVGSFRLYDG